MKVLAKPDLRREREGNTGVEGVWHWRAAERGNDVLVSALVHGNEPCGAWALKHALEAGLRPRRGSLTLMLANLEAFDRFDPAQPDAARFVEEDLNRVWSAARLAEPGHSSERRRALALLPYVRRADTLLDLHSMHERGAPLALPGPLRHHAVFARALGAPAHTVIDEGHADGTRLRDFGRFGDAQCTEVCALLVECGWHGDVSSVDVALDMLARTLRQTGCLDVRDIPPAWVRPPAMPQPAVRVTHAVVAHSMELQFAQDWRSMQLVPQAGTLLGSNAGEPFVTPYDNCVIVMPSLRQLRPGVTVMRLARADG
jgi:predicted deacylase